MVYNGLSIQEMVSKTEDQRKLIEKALDGNSGKNAGWCPAEDGATIFANQGRQDFKDLKESLHEIPLQALIAAAADDLKLPYRAKEYLIASGTTGVQGAAYLIPDKIQDIFYTASNATDIAPLVAEIVNPAGSSIKIDVEVDGQYDGGQVAGGAAAPESVIETQQVTITPKLWKIRPAITLELIEDSQFDIMETHLRRAGEIMGQWSTENVLYPIMKDHADSATNFGADGSYNTVSNGGDYVYASDLVAAWCENNSDGFKSDTVILNPFSTMHLFKAESAGIGVNMDWFQFAGSTPGIGKFYGMNVVQCTHQTSSMTPGYAANRSGLYSTTWHEIVLSKANCLVQARKRWMQIEKYSDPVRDLVGAVVSSRFESNLKYRDAACVCSHA